MEQALAYFRLRTFFARSSAEFDIIACLYYMQANCASAGVFLYFCGCVRYALWIFSLLLQFVLRIFIEYGAGRDRTDDLLNAIQALFQLSYSPD